MFEYYSSALNDEDKRKGSKLLVAFGMFKFGMGFRDIKSNMIENEW